MANEPDPHPEPQSDPVEVGTPPCAAATKPDRREFLAKVATLGIGVVIVAVPAGAGLASLLSPLARKGRSGITVRLGKVEDLPEDGAPRYYEVVAERTDAWTRHAPQVIGGVFLRRLPEGGISALSSICPHAGCRVGFKSLSEGFYCPCHESQFLLDGERGEVNVSPRPMDGLEIDSGKLAEGEVWVTFQRFRTGIVGKEVLS
jgi:menaquinol-cytochrome c reductase iron-sulfur subunit